MKLQELTSKLGVNAKQMSKTVKTTTVYPDYYFSIFQFELLPFVSIRRETDNRTVSYCRKPVHIGLSIYRHSPTQEPTFIREGGLVSMFLLVVRSTAYWSEGIKLAIPGSAVECFTTEPNPLARSTIVHKCCFIFSCIVFVFQWKNSNRQLQSMLFWVSIINKILYIYFSYMFLYNFLVNNKYFLACLFK